MNWTGGAKQRHSNGAGSLKHRQQQHFAKVKAGILAGKKQSPRKHTNLDRLRELHEGSSRTRQPSVAIITPRGFPTRDDRQSSQRHANSFPSNDIRGPKLSHSPAIQRHPITAIKQERLSNNGIRIPAPTPLREKLEYQQNSVASGGVDYEVEGSLFEKRRKILLKGDWVSVGFQRPPQVANVSSQNKQEVGRRRKVRDGHRPQYGNRQQSSLATKDHRHHQTSPREYHERAPRNSGQPGVKISIGGKVKAPGLSSSSAPRIRSQGSNRIIFNRQLSHSSDIMLLDNERLRSGSMSFKSLSSFQLANVNRATPEHQRQPLFCPSSASLVHPIPRSSIVAPILRSDSIDMNVAGSTIAQVGRSKPAVPSSEALDNNIWETWMQAIIPENYSSVEPSIVQQNVHISPGVSAAPTYGPIYDAAEGPAVDYFDENSTYLTSFQLPDIPMDLGGRDETSLSNGNLTVEGTAYFEETGETNAGSDILDDYSIGREYAQPVLGLFTQSPPGSSPISHRKFKLPSPLPEMASDEVDASSSSVSLSPGRQSYTKSPIPNQQEQNNQRNFGINNWNATGALSSIVAKGVELPVIMEESAADDIWRHFVFGSDGEDIDIFGPESAPSASNLGQPYGSSVVVQQALSNFETSPGEKLGNASRFFPREQPTAYLLEYRMADDGSSYLEQDENTYTLGARTDRATRDGSSSLIGSEGLSRPIPTASIRTPSGDVTDVSTTQTDPRTFTIASPVQRPKKKVMFTNPSPFISSLVESSSEKEEIVHIVKRNNGKKPPVKSNGAGKKKREKDIYSLPSSNSETESIEDD